MRTSEERIEQLHRRADALQKQKARRQLYGLGSMSVFFAVLLTAIIVQSDKLSHSITEGQLTGSSLLGDGAGGYVLIAVIAFFVGVILTAILIKKKRT